MKSSRQKDRPKSKRASERQMVPSAVRVPIFYSANAPPNHTIATATSNHPLSPSNTTAASFNRTAVPSASNRKSPPSMSNRTVIPSTMVRSSPRSTSNRKKPHSVDCRKKRLEDDPNFQKVKIFFELKPGEKVGKKDCIHLFQKNKDGIYDSLLGGQVLVDGKMQDNFIKFSAMTVELVRAICSKFGITRLSKKQDQMDGIHMVLTRKSSVTSIVKVHERKRIELGRIMMRFIGVIFSPDYRDDFSKLNQIQTRKQFETGSGDCVKDFYERVTNEILDDTSSLHDRVLPPENSVYRFQYNKYLRDEFSLEDDIYPCLPLCVPGTEVDLARVSMENLKKILVQLEKVRKVMTSNMERSGTNSCDPMEFVDNSIIGAKATMHIPKLAAFYFFVMCEVHDIVASSFSRDLHPDLAADTITGIPLDLVRQTKKPNKQQLASAVTVEPNVLSALALSDTVAHQTTVGSRATCTDYMVTMKQELLQKNRALRMDLFFKKLDRTLSQKDKEYIEKEIANIESMEITLNDEIHRGHKMADALRGKESGTLDLSNDNDLPNYLPNNGTLSYDDEDDNVDEVDNDVNETLQVEAAIRASLNDARPSGRNDSGKRRAVSLNDARPSGRNDSGKRRASSLPDPIHRRMDASYHMNSASDNNSNDS